MGTIGGGEVLVVLVVALIVLGPQKLPEAVRQLARVAGEIRRVSSGFQRELREVIEEPAPSITDPLPASPVTANPAPASPPEPEQLP